MQEFLCNISSAAGEYLVFQYGNQGVKLVFGGFPADGDPERAVHHPVAAAHSNQHMTAVTLGAGRAGGYADAVILQNVDGVLGRQPRNGEGENVRRLVAAVDLQTLQGG